MNIVFIQDNGINYSTSHSTIKSETSSQTISNEQKTNQKEENVLFQLIAAV